MKSNIGVMCYEAEQGRLTGNLKLPLCKAMRSMELNAFSTSGAGLGVTCPQSSRPVKSCL